MRNHFTTALQDFQDMIKPKTEYFLKKNKLYQLLLILIVGAFVNEKCHAQCYDRFKALALYYQPSTTFGVELQSMPSEGYTWGYIGGLNMGVVKEPAKGGTYDHVAQCSFYFKLLYRLNRYVLPTVGIGIQNMFDPYVMAGVRFMIQVGSGQSVFYIEPIVSTWKSSVQIGYAFAIN